MENIRLSFNGVNLIDLSRLLVFWTMFLKQKHE